MNLKGTREQDLWFHYSPVLLNLQLCRKFRQISLLLRVLGELEKPPDAVDLSLNLLASQSGMLERKRAIEKGVVVSLYAL